MEYVALGLAIFGGFALLAFILPYVVRGIARLRGATDRPTMSSTPPVTQPCPNCSAPVAATPLQNDVYCSNCHRWIEVSTWRVVDIVPENPPRQG